MSTIYQHLTSLEEILPHYDTYLIDMWGVLHDGHTLFPHTLDTLNLLKKNDKKVLFLTNAPRLRTALQIMLDGMGLLRDLYDGIQSSGDTTVEELKNPHHPLFNQPFYLMGHPTLHQSIKEALHPLGKVHLQEAKFVLLTHAHEDYKPLLYQALGLNLPLVCANPDRIAIEKGQYRLCPGELAATYKAQGGKVIAYGKPEPQIYHHAIHQLEMPDLKRVIAIGDGLITDIQGANKFGIDSIFIKSGIEKDTNLEHLNQRIQKEKIYPTYCLEKFS